MITIGLEIDDARSGCGTFYLKEDGYTIVVCSVDNEQVGILKNLIGDYYKGEMTW